MNCSLNELSAKAPFAEAFVVGMTDRMPRLTSSVMRQEQTELSSGVLNLQQYAALRFMADQGPVTMRCLTRELHLKPSHVTGLMDRLVARRMVRRGSDPRDRRVVLVSITPRGHAVLRRIQVEKRKTMRRIFDALDEQERDMLLVILDKLLACFDRDNAVGEGKKP